MKLLFAHSILRRLAACFLILFCVEAIALAQAAPGRDSFSYYTVRPGSILRLEGKSNVNKFNCCCNEKFQPASFTLQEGGAGSSLKFNGTYLNIRTKSLDCGNKIMNTDMYKALNANTHPVILFEPLQVTATEIATLKKPGNKHSQLQVYAKITLNGHSKSYWMDINAQKLQGNSYRFTGSKSLLMTDFNVKPPEAMFGMIKVEDEILIYFDLTVDLH
jgi:hypothetical protein